MIALSRFQRLGVEFTRGRAVGEVIGSLSLLGVAGRSMLSQTLFGIASV